MGNVSSSGGSFDSLTPRRPALGSTCGIPAGASLPADRASCLRSRNPSLFVGSPAAILKSVDEPLTFHTTCGENIVLEADRRRAVRFESFCKGICFSSRPVRSSEKVCLRVVSLSASWSGFLRIGFTSHNPAEMARSQLPRYACPDLEKEPGYWAKAVPDRFSAVNNVISYHVTADGNVHLQLNQENFGVLFGGVDTRTSLWALVDVYGNCTGVEFVDDIVLPSAIEIPENTPLKLYKCTVPQTLSLHSFCGKNVSLSADRAIAVRHSAQYDNAYVFTSRPILLKEKVVLQILAVDKSFNGGLTVGMTSCDPSLLKKDDMPDDSDTLLDRKEYWVVHKDVHVNAVCGDELAFSLSSEGEVYFGKGGSHGSVILHVDKTTPMWLFFDLYGQISKIHFRGIAAIAAGAVLPTFGLQPLPAISAGAASYQVSDGARSLPDESAGRSMPREIEQLRVELPPIIPLSGGYHSDVPARPLTTSVTQSADVRPSLPPVPPRIARGSGATRSAASVVAAPAQRSHADAQVPAVHQMAEVAAPRASSQADNRPRINQNNECIVCFEKQCDTVVYTCGHVCMCFECASSIKEQACPLCPICRQKIQDVIRMFRS